MGSATQQHWLAVAQETLMAWPLAYRAEPDVVTTKATPCPCLKWAGDMREVWPNGHHPLCDGTGHHHDPTPAPRALPTSGEIRGRIAATFRATRPPQQVTQLDDDSAHWYANAAMEHVVPLLSTPQVSSSEPMPCGHCTTQGPLIQLSMGCAVHGAVWEWLITTDDADEIQATLSGPALPTGGATLIADERARQIAEEGYDAGHDAGQFPQALADAAISYATAPGQRRMVEGAPITWPWPVNTFKPTPGNRIRELVKAGALIAAAIDRLLEIQRSPQQSAQGCGYHAHTLNESTAAAQAALPPERREDPVTWSHCADCHGDEHDHTVARGLPSPGGPLCGHTAGCPNC